jgi:hypothetical protein
MAPTIPPAAHANPAVPAPAPATPAATASSSKADTPKKSDNELLTKLSEKNPVLGAVLSSVVVANPALKVAQGCMGPSCAGFRDFLLRGTVVDMAVAIVLGLAFVELIKAFISCLLTPLVAAIWKKKRFAEAKWVLRGSEIMYGKFVNTLLVFCLVCLILCVGFGFLLEREWRVWGCVGTFLSRLPRGGHRETSRAWRRRNKHDPTHLTPPLSLSFSLPPSYPSIRYYLIALPMMHLVAIQDPAESRRPCPKCLSDIPAGAIKCRFCTADVPISANLQAKMAADPTGEIQAELEEVRENKLSSYFNFRAWMPARG